jgi:hypothetical protein
LVLARSFGEIVEDSVLKKPAAGHSKSLFQNTFALAAPVLFFLAYEDTQRAIFQAVDAAAV